MLAKKRTPAKLQNLMQLSHTTYPTTVKEHFKAIYFETIDAVHNTLREGFEQPSFINFSNEEHFVSVYADDDETKALLSELLVLRTCLNL